MTSTATTGGGGGGASTTSRMRYEKMDPITHIHRRTDMYIGDPNVTLHPADWLFIDGRMQFVTEPRYSDGLVRIIIEPLSNMIDNLWRSKEAKVKCSKLALRVTPTGIEFWNDGLGIPVCRASETGGGDEAGGGGGGGDMYVPEMIFGHLLTSSNYDDKEDRFTSGRNGIGVKLSNVFSNLFQVEIGDADRGLVYTQTWKNHMRDAEKPVIRKKSSLKHSYTRIYFEPDFKCFGMTSWDDTLKAWIHKVAHDTATLTGIPFHLNWCAEEPLVIKIKNLKDYATRYFIDSSSPANNTMIDGRAELDRNQSVDYVIAFLDPAAGYRDMGFVNGIYNREGGVHTDAVSGDLFRQLMAKLQKSHKQFPLAVKDLRPGFMIWVHAQLINPAFTSQNKTRLVSPTPKVSIPTRIIDNICKWTAFKEKIEEDIRAKMASTLKKTENKKRTGAMVRIDGLDPANLAGTNRSDECTLILCEGLSAKTYAVVGIQIGYNGRKGRDFFGIYPLRGKLLNCRNASLASVAQNKEITDLIQAMNLRHNVDYRLPENRRQLHYGRVLILTDSDVDGLHIASLILNAFHVLFPTLCATTEGPPFLTWMMTPVAKFYYPRSTETFYNDFEYQGALEALKTTVPAPPQPKIKYFKGLGTCSNAEVGETFGQKVVIFDWDAKSTDSMNKAFQSSHSNDRKTWMEKYSKDNYQVPEETYAVTTFIDQELIRYSIDDCMRSLPNLLDGLKQSQRKILYAVFKKNLRQKSMKVAQLSGYVAEVSNYHHGEQCLYDTITKMAHHFVGSNNIPYLVRDGQFGCLDPSTPVCMADGTTEIVSNIRVGNKVLGDDWNPRTVLKKVAGVDEMYEIRVLPEHLRYTVNSEHILTLCGPVREWDSEGAGWILRLSKTVVCIADFPIYNSEDDTNLTLWDIRLADFLKLPEEWKNEFRTFVIQGSEYPFMVVPLGEGPFSGFQLDGNERFVLGNGIVTHNSRSYLGKDAANARYIFTRMDPLLRKIFPAVDDELLPITLDDGDLVEPEYYVPVLPMILVNGCSAGIGTGWSCSVPCFHPLRLLDKILDFIHDQLIKEDDEDDPAWIPWYRYFIGNITRNEKKRSFTTEGVLRAPGQFTLPPEVLEDSTTTTTGRTSSSKKKKVLGAATWCVEEIPVRESINRYKEFLEKMQEEKQIRGLTNYSSADKPLFLFDPVPPFLPTVTNMKLQSEVSVSNLVLWTDDQHLHKFRDIPEVFYAFCKKRQKMYEDRKVYLLKVWGKQLEKMQAVYRFLKEVSEDVIKVFKTPDEDIIRQLQERGYPMVEDSYDYLLGIRIRQFSKQNWENQEMRIRNLEGRIAALQKTPPGGLWKADLAVFLEEYKKMYPEETENTDRLQRRIGKTVAEALEDDNRDNRDD